MSTVKQLLDSLLWDIYGKQQQVESSVDHRHNNMLKRHKKYKNISKMARSFLGLNHDSNILQKLGVRKLVDICAILKVEIRLMGYFLERVLIERDRHQRHQEILCGFMDALLQVECHDAHPKMRFSLSPPPTKATSAATSPTMHSQHRTSAKSDEEPTETADDAASDYKQWLHAMKLVARLPGGMPPEFRRKLWLSLADKYLKSKNLDWVKEEEKCFCEKWREDDEELGIQIVKDLHRTGSNLCTGPAGTINQAKLKRILLGYARYNPEVGYCQGFNMLGALILQVMDKEESESMKVMIYLVEGVLPPGYFCGSMGGLQADMGVFRELMTSKLPRLAKHLQKLQGPIENAYEPPLTNVFTMQWFLTMFCTCLPMTCVLRVWDLVLIEGSDVLLRTALVLWSLLEERILSARTADDFYCKMGSFSSELLNGHLIDSNGLIEKVVQLGPIPDIQRLRDKHLYNIAPLRHKQGLQLYYDDEEPESDEESRLAVATVWGIPWGRRGSVGQTTNNKPLQLENKDRIALDISLLKKQYDRLRERQKQAHIILTTACSTAARQSSSSIGTNPTLPVNNLLMGRSAIVTNKGRRIGPPTGAIPPARKPSLPTILQTSTRPPEKQLRRGETLHWRDTDLTKRRRDSLSWKEIKADRSTSRDSSENLEPRKLRTRIGKSDSSSYSEESDDTEGSSTDTSLCDEDDLATSADKTHGSLSVENSPKKRSKSSRKQKELSSKIRQSTDSKESNKERRRPKSWAPSNDEIPFMLMTSESPVHSGDERSIKRRLYDETTTKEEEDSATESDRLGYKLPDNLDWTGTKYSPLAGDLATTTLDPLHIQTDVLELPVITSMSQLSPLPDISKYLTGSTISPMPTPKPLFLDSTNSLGSGDGEEANKFDVSDDGVTNEYFERVNSVERPNKLDLFYSLSEEDSIRNAYESNDDEPIAEVSPTEDKAVQNPEIELKMSKEIQERADIEGCEATITDAEIDATSNKRKIQEQIRMELLDDYSEKSSVAFIAEATNEVSTSYSKQKENDLINEIKITRSFGAENSDLIDIKNENRKTYQRKFSLSEASRKRRDPRRLTIARSYTIETADTYQRLDKNHYDDKIKERDNEIENLLIERNADMDDTLEKEKLPVIPSTADLEDRYNRLEKQLSESKKSIEDTQLEDSEEKTQRVENSSPSVKPDENVMRTKRTEIPSTADLEDRFSALEKQMSIQTLEPRNEEELIPIEPENDKNKEDEEPGDECIVKNVTGSSEVKARVPDDKEDTFVSASLQHNVKDLDPTDISETDTCLKKKTPTVKSTIIDNPEIESKELKLSCPPASLNVETSVSPQSIEKKYADDPNEASNDNKIDKMDENRKSEELQHSLEPTDIKIESQDTTVEARQDDTEMDIPTNPVTSSTNSELEKPVDISKIKQPKLSEGTTQNETKSMSDAEPEKPSRSHIPSTKDLENRFSALEKQMSSQSINSKDAIEMGKKSSESEREKLSEKSKNNQKRTPESTEAPAKTQADATNSTKAASKETESKPRLSKIPSTAELEDRFNALERKMSISKNSPSKTKKEPPDGPRNKAESNMKEVTKETQEVIVKDEKEKDKKKEMVASNNKSPPSTEELDKRFEAFEKTLGAANKTTDKKKKKDIQAEEVGEKEIGENSKKAESKSPQNFHEKVKAINEQLIESEKTSNTASNVCTDGIGENSRSSKESKKEAMKSFQTKSKVINETLGQGNATHNDPQQSKIPDNNSETHPSEQLPMTSKRRASEPPTTEDLETRYEALKRRMSTKSFAESNDKKKTLLRSETVEEALERIEKEVLEETIDIDQEEPAISKTEEEVSEKISPESIALMKNKEIVKRRASEPPTTEELEKRYEKLKRKMSTTTESFHESYDPEDIDFPKKTTFKEPDKEQVSEATTSLKHESNDKPTMPPVPPPMQATKTPPSLPPKVQNHRRALVQELQSKMIPNDTNLKPSDVNPNRKTPPHQHATMADETSETHATTASMRLKNYEPWHMQPQKMVRRFSDLPSRADLENRVHFLEQQLSLKYVKQRSASDSEVASRTHFVGLKETAHDAPSTSAKAKRQESDLENRVIALEKQLSENSLKLVEAMRRKSKESGEHIVEGSVSTTGPNVEGAEPDIRTGMELVRYTHYGEIEETESAKPINISINIKMHINKESEEKRKKIASPKTEVLEKRLEALEEKLSKNENKTIVKDQTEVLDVKKTEEKRAEKSTEVITKERNQREPVKDESAKMQLKEDTTTMTKEEDTKSITTSQESLNKTQEKPALKQEETLTKPKPTQDKHQKQEILSSNQQVALPKEPIEENKEEQIKTDPQATNKEQQQKSATTKATSAVTVKAKAKTANELKTSKTEQAVVKPPLADSTKTSSENMESVETKTQPSVSASNTAVVEPNELNNKNMVLPLDSEPTGNKVRRLTRANTEELEGLLQALEIQLSNRNLVKSENGKLIRADSIPQTNATQPTQTQEQSEALANLSKEIQEFTSADKDEKTAKAEQIEKPEKDEYDWGPDPVKRHLKRSTVYLPSTRELEARYRSLERQIKLLEDVEKIDVEQRLNEIERKIKLQYSLSHEKDLSKYLELCEGKLPDDDVAVSTTPSKSPKSSRASTPHTSPGRSKVKTPYTSPTRAHDKTSYTSPTRTQERSPYTSPYTSPSRSNKRTTYTSPARQRRDDERLPTTDDLEYRYRVLDLVRSKSKDNLDGKLKKKPALKKQPIHPLEMLLDPSPVESEIPTTGELEHRMRVLDGRCQTPSPPRKARQRSSSPTVDDIMREKLLEDQRPKTTIHTLETMVASPTRKELPTEEELEARMRALEEDQKFDFKMQKNYKEFNQKLRDVISPSLSFEEFKAAKSREQSPKRAATLPKSALKDHDIDYERDEITCRSTSPKMIRFREDEDEQHRSKAAKDYREHQYHQQKDAVKMVGTSNSVLTIIEENSKMLHHILKKTLADSSGSSISESAASAKGLEVLGPRLMRETSPLRRTGTHTGIPLRTDDNINDRLNSIKNTIKSIDSLCEEKPYRKEKCQRYIDSLFTESVYFASPSKKASLEDLTYKRRSGEYAPSIRISDHSQRSSEYLSRSMGSAESIRSTSPLHAASPLHHRSTRELRRDISPRRHRVDEERDEFESRVRTRVNLLPKYYLDDSNESLSRSSLTKFYKVDNELDTYKLIDDKARSDSRSVSRSPLRSPYGSRETMTAFPTPQHNNTTTLSHTSMATSSKRLDLDRPVSPYRQTSHNLLGYDSTSLTHAKSPVYNPAKLEIRHTTVTSTFYDRLLTEKQIEKSLSRPPSRSPLVSPSVAVQSNLDLPMSTSSVYNPKSSGNSPLTPVRSTAAIVGAGGDEFGLVGSGTNCLYNYTSDANTTTTTNNTFNTATTMSTGNSSTFPNSYLARLPPTVTDCNSSEFHLRNSENMLMQLSTTSAGAGHISNMPITTTIDIPTAFTTSTTTSTAISSYATFLNTIGTGTAAGTGSVTGTVTTTATTTNSAYNATFGLSSAGDYNPLMPLNLRPPPEIGIQFGHQHQHTNITNSTLNNNNTTANAMNLSQS